MRPATAGAHSATSSSARIAFAIRSCWAREIIDREELLVFVDAAEANETIRPFLPLAESLGKLKPAFKEGGKITAGNSSQITDGAGAVLLMTREKADALGVKPLARIVGYAAGGVDPAYMGLGPVPAIRRALQSAGMALGDIDMIELNEAFASQGLATLRELGVADDAAHVNPNGGAIALGHPLGCSGSRIVGTLLHLMKDRGAKLGVAAMCIGIGQGVATVLERD